MAQKSGLVVGFDLGGTKMISSVMTAGLEVLASHKQKTNAQEGGEAVFARIVETIAASLKKAGVEASQLDGIGIASPGPLDSVKGIILDTPNLGFSNFPLGGRLEKELGVPVVLENDVNAGTYGEFVRGAARGFRHVVGIFPGTGIGGGLILDGKLFRGATGNAGEIGHMIIQTDGPLCGCGQYGCVESLASRTALAKDVAALAGSGDSPCVIAKAGTNLKNYRSSIFAKAIDQGDQQVERVVRRSARFLGVAMANCVNLLSPEIIVLGGGLVDKLGDWYVRIAEKSMRDHTMAHLTEGVKVVQAELGDGAAIIGAVCLAREALKAR